VDEISRNCLNFCQRNRSTFFSRVAEKNRAKQRHLAAKSRNSRNNLESWKFDENRVIKLKLGEKSRQTALSLPFDLIDLFSAELSDQQNSSGEKFESWRCSFCRDFSLLLLGNIKEQFLHENLTKIAENSTRKSYNLQSKYICLEYVSICVPVPVSRVVQTSLRS
jgi:hypothetical protein